MTTPPYQDEIDTPTRRLWTPWRMRYVGGGATEDGCVFCNRHDGNDDVASLILYRAETSFVIMNLFPYNTGHVMVVPNHHVASPEDAPLDALREMAELIPPLLRALRRVLACHGFNLGTNVGSIAGAGVAEHMHQHIVPRWTGDANFMPIVGGATVMPELIPVTYAKVRAELMREMGHANTPTRLVVFDAGRSRVLVEQDGSLPLVEAMPGIPIWRAAIAAAGERNVEAHVAGWAADPMAGPRTSIALTLLVDNVADSSGAPRFLDLQEARASLVPPEAETLERAVGRMMTTGV